jgi:hypothetical protein
MDKQHDETDRDGEKARKREIKGKDAYTNERDSTIITKQ